jgi:hypothetical protein
LGGGGGGVGGRYKSFSFVDSQPILMQKGPIEGSFFVLYDATITIFTDSRKDFFLTVKNNLVCPHAFITGLGLCTSPAFLTHGRHCQFVSRTLVVWRFTHPWLCICIKRQEPGVVGVPPTAV